MSNHKITQHSDTEFSISGTLDHKTVTSLWQQRDTLLSKDNAHCAVIDLGAITHSDSAGVAYLTCLQSEALTYHQQLSFINIPLQLQQLIELSRLEDVLNIQQRL